MSDAENIQNMLSLTTRQRQHHPETLRALQAAEGYTSLGLYREALKELDRVQSVEQEDCDMLIARVRVLMHLKRWSAAARLSLRGERLYGDEDEFTVQRVFSLHKLDKSAEAARVLEEAPEWLRRTGILHYNLGCYEARWGNLTLARQCVQTAIKMNEGIKKNARQDPDLAALWGN